MPKEYSCPACNATIFEERRIVKVVAPGRSQILHRIYHCQGCGAEFRGIDRLKEKEIAHAP